MEPTDASRKPLVLRVEIAPEHLDSLGTLLGAPARQPAPPTPDPAPAPPAAPSVAEAEVAAAQADELTASDRIRLAHRARRVQELEQELAAREELLDQRETELYRREAAFEADVSLREEQLEEWRRELGDLEGKLKRKERELLAYVAQLQEEFVRREAAGWGAVPAHIRH